uniref:ABC transporter G family member 23 n=2 Tax=Lygus hesperus TaxID=30085 RepID=A0A146KR47_LYGHE
MMAECEPPPGSAAAVVVRGAYKRYTSSAVVLNGLNMTVEKGTVYGFLGPSGCGKTTLLSCIVGRNSLDAGSISLTVKSRSNIGYMPQELALSKEFRIAETMSYYGHLYGLDSSVLKKRKEELYALLDLPSEEKVIDKLSGGQQRRTSLCVALLHDPELLILDEPTCGVDPLLSHSIWQHLMALSRNYKKTIIITTHYIEEARQADRIGLMRGGEILAENSPNQLMVSNGCDNLEKVFLLLSQKQAVTYDNSKIVKDYPKPKSKPPPPIKPRRTITWGHVYSHIIKSYYWLNANKPIVGFLMMLPIVQCFLFQLTVGRDPDGLQFGFINGEVANWRENCFDFANESCFLDYGFASCKFLDTLTRQSVELVEYPDETSARNAVRQNAVWGFLRISTNYTAALRDRVFNSRIEVLDLSEEAAPDMGVSDVKVWLDMSNQYIGYLLQRSLYFAYQDFYRDVHVSCDINPDVAKIPIKWEDAIYGSNSPSFSEFAVPAILQLFEFYLPMMFTVGAILMEKREGLLERSLISGMTLPEVLVGHAIVQFMVLAIQTLFMMLVLYVAFDNVIKGSAALALALLALVGLCGMCYGIFVSAICDSDQAATYMGLGSFFPLAMLSGMVWPFEGMHWTLRSVGWLLPLTMTTESYRSIAQRGWSMGHHTVYAGFISSLGWSIFFILATYFIVVINKSIRLLK